jgi:sugar-specific transcriptional regulator TrmB
MWQKLCEYLGLSEYEAKVYVSLIEAGVAKARTLSLMSGVPRTKVYGILRKLIDTGLIVEMPEEPKKFAPNPPKTAFESYLHSYQNNAKNFLSVITFLDETFRKAKNEGMPQQETMWIINGRQEILGKIQEMLSRARSSVDLATNEETLILLYKVFNKMFDELAERRVKIRIATVLNSNSQHVINELRYTCEIEETDFCLPFIFLCIDEKQFLLTNLRQNDHPLNSARDRSIFSSNLFLREMIDSLVRKRSDASILQPLTGAQKVA